jgi:transcriptional regulator with XRE-family HTH domain
MAEPHDEVDQRQILEQRLADVGDFIRTQREVARMSVRRLAEVAGVSNPYLSQIERGLRKPSAEILQQIAKALQISAETLYERAGLLSDIGEPRGVRAAIAADPRLTPEQQQALLNVYESFVSSRVERD